MTAYYNEIDPYAAQWLRNLIALDLIAPGDVDERSIADVRPSDLAAYTQCHFFAGIGGWSYALRLAGWPDDKPVWTGSCPCQPFSQAGAQRGFDDARHLWPVWFRLIRECRPAIVFGEQVASAIKLGWLDEVFADLEADNYACGSAVLPAFAVGADHERKRLYYLANACEPRRERPFDVARSSVCAEAAFALDSDPLARARRALAGDYSSLLPSDGVSITVERSRTHGYGNAIVPQVAALFIRNAVLSVADVANGEPEQ